MSEPDPEHVETKASEDTKNVLVVDPEDYQRTRKLKAINDAKKKFKEINRNHTEVYREMKNAWSNPKEAVRRQRAHLLVGYASELLPLIEDGLEAGTLSEDDLMVPLTSSRVELDIRKIIREDGHIPTSDERKPLGRPSCMSVYRQLERIERKLGLGLELEEDKGPAQI